MNRDIVRRAFLGAAVGDALGVPYEFIPREKMKEKPCTGMRGGGSHLMPKGTWSDDTSMLLATADGICDGIGAITKNYMKWLTLGFYAPGHFVFDVGATTRMAIMRSPFTHPSGLTDERNNGNGSLMRILPAAFYLLDEENEDARRNLVYDISAITHAHIISKEGCFLYVELARHMLKGESPLESYRNTCKSPVEAYKRYSEGNLNELSEDKISSSGYIVDTLEAAVWCLLTTDSYSECVLKAVNLGRDTDTVACVAGGLAGIIYDVPLKWKMQLKNRKLIDKVADRMLMGMKDK